MKSNIIVASIIAVGLMGAAFLHSGRYYVLTVDKGIAVRVDRWTGSLLLCDMSDVDWPVSCRQVEPRQQVNSTGGDAATKVDETLTTENIDTPSN